MPIHLDDLDVIPDVAGLRSALIVPCYMCPAVTVAVREGKPFLRLFRNFLRSAPFEQYIHTLQSRLEEKGVDTDVFESRLPHHWFLCMWSSSRRQKLENAAKRHDAVIVLGCGSATETVREAVGSTGCKVIDGMSVAGVMNAKLRLHVSGTVSFEDCRITSLTSQRDSTDTIPDKRDDRAPHGPPPRPARRRQRMAV